MRGSLVPGATIAEKDQKLGNLSMEKPKGYVNCLGALTGGQAVQQAKAGIEAIYLWVVTVRLTIIQQALCTQSVSVSSGFCSKCS